MNPEIIDKINKPSHYQGANGLEDLKKPERILTGLSRRWNMRIKTLMGTIINVDRIKRSITVEGIELGSDCRALVSKHKDGTGTITLVFDGKII